MKSAFSRIFYPAAIILMAALLLVGAASQLLLKNHLKKQALADLQSDGAVIGDLVAVYNTQDLSSNREFLIHLSVAGEISGADAVILDPSGRLLLCSDSPEGCFHRGLWLNEKYLRQVLEEQCISGTGVISGFYKESRFVVIQTFTDLDGQVAGIVLLSKPVSQANSVLRKMSSIYLYVALTAVCISILLMTLLLRRQNAPLRQLSRVARDFGHGKLDSRTQIDPHSALEVQELALAFNNMADSLQKSEYQRQEFVANVSHELKTPMTTISGFVDGMLDGTIPPEKHTHYMRLVSDETKRLSRLVRSMLDVSRLQEQGGVPEEKKTRFDLSECAGQVLITFEQKIVGKALDVQVDLPEHPVYTYADPDSITQVFYNLLDNAVKFCPVGKKLGLSIQEGGDKLYVRIQNEGPTVPPEELPLLFDRFHKLDKSRSENRDGWGLGLYIVKTIICGHGENIAVTSKDGKTEFIFTLPLVN